MNLSIHEKTWLEKEGAKALTNIGIKKGYKVVDYGCGQGRYTIPLSQIVGETGGVFSVERDEKVLSVVEKRLCIFSNPNIVTLIHNETLETSGIVAEKSIDAIFAFDVLQYIQDWDMLFRYFYSILKATGIVYIYPAEIPHPGSIDIHLVIEKMEKQGFKYETSHTLQMMHNVDMVCDNVYCFCLK